MLATLFHTDRSPIHAMWNDLSTQIYDYLNHMTLADSVERYHTELARQRADALAKVLKEAGVVIYAQTPGAKGGYKEVKAENEAAAGGARPSGSGPRGRVVDADYEESR